MAGRWVRTNEKPQWIGGLEVRVDADDLLVRVHGGGAGPSPADWGVARTTTVYAGDLSGGDARAGAFVAHFQLPHPDLELQAELNPGPPVLAPLLPLPQPGPH